MSKSSSESGDENRIHLHVAKHIINEDAYIFRPEVLNTISIDDIVRISYVIDYSPYSSWSHDSPFVKIIKRDGADFLGTVLDINRIRNTNKYLLNIGEKVWFNTSNIIEISTNSKGGLDPLKTSIKLMRFALRASPLSLWVY